MKNIFKGILTGSVTLLLTANLAYSASGSYKAVDEFSKEKFNVNTASLVKNASLTSKDVDFNEKDLLYVLKNTREYFDKYSREDEVVRRNGFLEAQGVTVQEVIKTVDFMITVLEEDISNNRPARLKDPAFLSKNFRVLRWFPMNYQDPKQKEQIRITKYAIFTHEGSKVKTAKYNHPLYALKEDAETDKFYKKYTKHDVLSGIYEKGGKEAGRTEPLVYLTREALEEALMEGTILINFTDGTSAYYNVDRNNGIAYVKGLDPKKQKRYWYFKKVNSINGYGKKIENRIKIKPGVTFAGDVFNVGLGKIVALEYTMKGKKMLKLGVIADTGGAFLPNLHQLDFLAGIYQDRKAFQNDAGNLPPSYVNAFFLIKK